MTVFDCSGFPYLAKTSDPNPQVSGESIFELVWRSFSW